MWRKPTKKEKKYKVDYKIGIYCKNNEERCDICAKSVSKGQNYIFFPYCEQPVTEHLDCYIWSMARAHYKQFGGVLRGGNKLTLKEKENRFNHKMGKYRKKNLTEICSACHKPMKAGQSYVSFPYFKELEHLSCFVWRTEWADYKQFQKQIAEECGEIMRR